MGGQVVFSVVHPLYGLNDPKPVYSLGQLMFYSITLGSTTTC